MMAVKMSASVAVLLVALMGVTSTASATTLTAPQGSTFTSGFRAENEGTVTFTSSFGGFGSISCTQSVLEGPISQHGSATTASIVLGKMTFTNCSGGEPTSPVANPGSLVFHYVNANEGAITSQNAQITVHKTLFGTCVFFTSSSGNFLGVLTTSLKTGSNATLDIKGTLNSACGNGTWHGSYKVTSPSTLYIDG
jgi:hypothetical protein